LAKVTTPYDVAWNQWIEKRVNHGSCGMGIGATMTREKQGFKLYAVDLLNKKVAKEKLKQIKEKYEKQASTSEADREEFLGLCGGREDYFFSLLDEDLYEIADYSILGGYNNLIFEGSQGVMLDMDHGIFPHVTYANTTSKNAMEICSKFDVDPEVYYITRCYQTRHGNGWMSNEDNIEIINNEEEINIKNKWQGQFRVGEIDYNLLNHTITLDSLYSGNIRKNLVVTCMDQRPDFKFEYDKINKEFFRIIESYSPDSQHFKVAHSKLRLLES
jgi:adenylosuccinate synthase